MVVSDLVADRPLRAAELAMFGIVAILLEAVVYLLDRRKAAREWRPAELRCRLIAAALSSAAGR
jgi:hypothetical protein